MQTTARLDLRLVSVPLLFYLSFPLHCLLERGPLVGRHGIVIRYRNVLAGLRELLKKLEGGALQRGSKVTARDRVEAPEESALGVPSPALVLGELGTELQQGVGSATTGGGEVQGWGQGDRKGEIGGFREM